MSGAGHVQDMNNRIKQNRVQRPSNRTKFKGNNRDNIYSSGPEQHRLRFKTVPEEELVELKERIKQRAIIDRKKDRFLLLILTLSVLIAATLIFWLV